MRDGLGHHADHADALAYRKTKRSLGEGFRIGERRVRAPTGSFSDGGRRTDVKLDRRLEEKDVVVDGNDREQERDE